MRRREARRGFSVLEVVIGVAILAGSVAAVIGLLSQESRTVGMTEERLTAVLLLEEVKQTLGGRAYDFYEQFPATVEGWNPLLDSLFESQVGIFDPNAASDLPVRKALKTTFERIHAHRYVLFEPFTTAAGTQAGKVTYLVTYTRDEEGPGTLKRVFTVEIVYR